MKLEDYLKESFPQGLTYNEAAQLCLHLYCSTEDIPEMLHEKCNKDYLPEAFSKLTKSGFIKGDHLLAARYGANFHNISDKDHWIEVIASIFKVGDVVDNEIRKSLSKELKLCQGG